MLAGAESDHVHGLLVVFNDRACGDHLAIGASTTAGSTW
jgi:hypothetical protein